MLSKSPLPPLLSVLFYYFEVHTQPRFRLRKIGFETDRKWIEVWIISSTSTIAMGDDTFNELT
jgi:hypothetical protein